MRGARHDAADHPARWAVVTLFYVLLVVAAVVLMWVAAAAIKRHEVRKRQLAELARIEAETQAAKQAIQTIKRAALDEMLRVVWANKRPPY